MVKKMVRRPRFNSSRRSSDLLMTFNRVMLFVVIALVVVAAVTYFAFVFGGKNKGVSYSPAVNLRNLALEGNSYGGRGGTCSVFTKCINSNAYIIRDGNCRSRTVNCTSGQTCSNGSCLN